MKTLDDVRVALAWRLGFGATPGSKFLGTLEDLLEIVRKEHDQLVAVRQAIK